MLGSILRSFVRARYAPRTGFTQLGPKYGNKNFYKGKGGRRVGWHTKKGEHARPDTPHVCKVPTGTHRPPILSQAPTRSTPRSSPTTRSPT